MKRPKKPPTIPAAPQWNIRRENTADQPAASPRHPKGRKPAGPRTPRPGPRGWRGPGCGQVGIVPNVPHWRGSTMQVCGLWPFSTGADTPLVGVPLGANILNGTTVCADPISWFRDVHLISNPSMFVLGRPGLGKSTICRRMLLGLAGFGVVPLVLADLKPDYLDLISAIGGQVITLSRAAGGLNVLDPGQAAEIAAKLTGSAREAVLAAAQGRRIEMVKALISIVQKAPVGVDDGNLLARALQILSDRRGNGPIETLTDLRAIINEAPTDLQAVTFTHGDLAAYRAKTRQLEAVLLAMQLPEGPISDLFARPTSEAMRRDRPVVYDVSAIKDGEKDLQAAALLACWSNGFAAVDHHNALADAGIEPRRNFFLVMDELWRVLRSGPDMVSRVDGLTRLNRQVGVGQALITHTMSDLLALPTEAEQMMARGFVERAGMVVLGGLPPGEMPLLHGAGVGLSEQEAAMVSGWSAPAAIDPDTGKESAPPGLGRFLIKLGQRPGIPVVVGLTAAELHLNDTNKRW